MSLQEGGGSSWRETFERNTKCSDSDLTPDPGPDPDPDLPVKHVEKGNHIKLLRTSLRHIGDCPEAKPVFKLTPEWRARGPEYRGGRCFRGIEHWGEQ